MLNKIELQGRICQDLELKSTPSGISVTSFTLASERNYKSGQGEKATDFIPVVAWRGDAEFITKYFSKGKMILVVGSLQSRQYTTGKGEKRTAYEVVVDEVNFCDSKKNDEAPLKEQPEIDNDFEPLNSVDDDLPFFEQPF